MHEGAFFGIIDMKRVVAKMHEKNIFVFEIFYFTIPGINKLYLNMIGAIGKQFNNVSFPYVSNITES